MLDKPRMFLHVGTHKTGTTSFQSLLSKNRMSLEDVGILYPDPSTYFGGSAKVHHAVAHALTETRPSEIETNEAFLAAVHHQALRSGAVVVLSTESLYGHIHGKRRWGSDQDVARYWRLRRRYVESAAKYLSNFSVTCQVALRRPDRYIESYYGERVVKSLVAESFAKWRERFSVLCDYSTQIDLLRSAFADVRVHRYEDARGGIENELIRDYGLAPGTLGPSIRSRPSADARVLLWFRIAQPGSWTLRRDFAASPEVRNSLPQYGRSTLWSQRQAQRAYNSQFSGDFGKRYFGRRYREDRFPAVLDDSSAQEINAAWTAWKASIAARHPIEAQS